MKRQKLSDEYIELSYCNTGTDDGVLHHGVIFPKPHDKGFL